VADSIFYCEVEGNPQNDYWEFAPGIYSIPDRLGYVTKIRRCMSYSTRVWIQGPRGGVRVRGEESGLFYYVTKDDVLMKEFMWVKLKAQPLKNYT
jgi:hypothetical protein